MATPTSKISNRESRGVFIAPSMQPSAARGQTPRHEVPQGPSGNFRTAAHAFYCDLTDGLTNRLPLRNAENLRRGVVRSAPVAVAELLEAGRRCGLGRAWALRLAVWVRAQVDALYPLDRTPLEVRRRTSLEMEGANNLREQAALLVDHGGPLTPAAADALWAEARTLEAELVADSDLLAAIYARLNRRGA